MIQPELFQGHIILYCKGHYQQRNVDFVTGLRRIWAVRCGLSVEHISKSIDEYIADEMIRIIELVRPEKMSYIWQIVHKELANDWNPEFDKDMTAIQKLIIIYKNIILQVQVKEKKNDKWSTLIKIPRPQKRLFKRIVRGNGRFGDYTSVK